VKFEAEQKVARAQAEAQALKLQNEQIAPQLIQLRQIEMMRETWDRQFPNVMLGGSGLLPFKDVSTFAQEGKHEAPIVMIWSKVAPGSSWENERVQDSFHERKMVLKS
jgi:hypothetical protein